MLQKQIKAQDEEIETLKQRIKELETGVSIQTKKTKIESKKSTPKKSKKKN